MDFDDPPARGGGRTPGEVIDIMSTIASRLGEGVRAPDSGFGHDTGAGPAGAPARTEAPPQPAAVPASTRSMSLAPLGIAALDEPLRTLTDGLALFGRAINDAAAQHVQALARHVDDLARRAADANAAATAAQGGVRDVAQRVQGAEATAADAAQQAREARGHLQEITRLLTEHASHADRIDAAFAAHTERLARLEAGAETGAMKIAGLIAANGALRQRAGRLRTFVILAFLALAALAAWTFWPEVTKVVALLPMH
jgi:hypothetical protein